MARRKRIKAGEAKLRRPQSEIADNAVKPDIAPEPQKAAENPSIAGKKQGTPAKGISVATCIAGMFLTLVLGMYLGTLLPGILADLQSHSHMSAEMRENAATPMPPAASAPQIEPELKKHIADAEKKAANKPDSAPDWVHLANLYFDANMPAEAIMAYEHALRLAPGNADALTDLGIMYREKGDFAKAVECFRKAVTINPRHENALFNEGVVLANDLHQKDQAEAAWKKLLEINPQAIAPNGTPLRELIQKLK